MKLKKLTMLALPVLALFAFAGCDKKTSKENTTNNVVTTSSTKNDKKYQIYLLA